MDPNTGRLRALSDEESSMLSLMKNIPEKLKGLEPLPERLNEEAVKELAGRKECFVDLNSNTSLAKWAKKKRSAAQKKNKRRKMAKKSRKINRRK